MGTNYGCPAKGWRYEPATMARKIEEGRVLFPGNKDGRPRHKLFLNEMRSLYKNMSSVITEFTTADGTKEVNALLKPGVFNFPKPVALIATLIEQATEPSDIVLDFFAGSGTTAHAVFLQNVADGGRRQFILIQLPEPLDPTKPHQKTASDFCDQIGRPRSIAELSKERIRRAGNVIKAESTLADRGLDTGFRVLKIDTSNMKDVYYAPDAIKQADLLAHLDNIREDRSAEDLLFQVLVDWGVDLSLPIATETLAGKTVFFVDGNALAACFDSDITEDLVKELAKRKPLRAVFRDSSYGNDSVKINVEQIFKLLSPGTEIKSL